MKFVSFLIFILMLPFVIKTSVSAFNPDLPNNKFGIHFALPSLEDLQKTKELVNSNGGDWGYVTLVMQENDRDKNKWQEVFDKMRELHLIPVIRLATIPQGAQWRKPTESDVDSWVNFLESLHWVVKDRYLILFNEPNHGAEWGGTTNPSDYAKVSLEFAKKLKAKNQDYFIMLAGLDLSAPHSPPNYYDAGSFLGEIIDNISVEQFNNLFSGLSSHSYPNPGFSGSPYDSGRKSIRSYEWELNLLRQLRVKELPVFISETGWRRGNAASIADYFRIAYEQVWLPDNRIRAITPFVFDYQGEPFINFSWKLPAATVTDEQEFHQQYYTVQSLSKVAGVPVQEEKGAIEFDLPRDLVTQSSYRFSVKLKNQGQAVWDKDFAYQLELAGSQPAGRQGQVGQFEYFTTDIKSVKPFAEADVDIFLKTNATLGKGEVQIVLTKQGNSVLDGGTWRFETFPLPDLNFAVNLLPKLQSAGADFEIQIFNDRDEIVLKKTKIKVENGQGIIKEVQNVALGRKYRIVILKPYYLPKQEFVTFQRGMNELKFEGMVPLDFNPDGKLDFQDVGRLFTQPDKFTLLFP